MLMLSVRFGPRFVYDELGVSFTAHSGLQNGRRPAVAVVVPTVQEVRHSIEGWAAGHRFVLSCGGEWWCCCDLRFTPCLHITLPLLVWPRTTSALYLAYRSQRRTLTGRRRFVVVDVFAAMWGEQRRRFVSPLPFLS